MDSIQSSDGEIKAASADASTSISASSDISENLITASIQSALAAIEIYNKPVFAYREQAFTILLINAWETLCKARLIRNAGGDSATIYVRKSDGTFKAGRSGNKLTVELVAAITRLALPEVVVANIFSLLDIRDTATHLYTEPAIQQLVHSLGVAALQNYHRLLSAWFGNRLADFNFQIMPLAFTHSFKTLAMLTLSEHAADVARLLQSVAESQASCPADGDFYFVCEIATELRSMKKLGDTAGIIANPVADAPGVPVIVKTQNSVDKYPLSYTELRAQVQAERPGTKPVQIDRIIRDSQMKQNPAYAAYNFRTKTLRERFEKHKTAGKNTTVIYNREAVRFIVAQIDEQCGTKTASPTVN